MSEYSYSDEYSESEPNENEEPIEISFVSKNKRLTQKKSESESDENENEEDIKKRKKESNKIAKKIAKQQTSSDTEDYEPWSEPPAPDANDAKANPDVEYKLWVEREVNRIREEILVEAKVAYDAAKTRQQKLMTDIELAKIKAKNDKERRANRGHMQYMQKYYHVGAFSSIISKEQNERAQELMSRDYTTPVGEDRLDKTSLPKEMLVRGDDYQKKGRTKWTHLANEDTTTKEMRDEAKFIESQQKHQNKIEPISNIHHKKKE